MAVTLILKMDLNMNLPDQLLIVELAHTASHRMAQTAMLGKVIFIRNQLSKQ